MLCMSHENRIQMLPTRNPRATRPRVTSYDDEDPVSCFMPHTSRVVGRSSLGTTAAAPEFGFDGAGDDVAEDLGQQLDGGPPQLIGVQHRRCRLQLLPRFADVCDSAILICKPFFRE